MRRQVTSTGDRKARLRIQIQDKDHGFLLSAHVEAATSKPHLKGEPCAAVAKCGAGKFEAWFDPEFGLKVKAEAYGYMPESIAWAPGDSLDLVIQLTRHPAFGLGMSPLL